MERISYNIGMGICDVLEKSNISEKDAAIQTGYSYREFRRILEGKLFLSPRALEDLASKLKTSAKYLISYKPNGNNLLPGLERESIARASIERHGKIIIVESLDEAMDVANKIAPEHLELQLDDPFTWLDKVRNAGSVFLGRNCPEAMGDYYAGPNHTLPTSGTAKFSSPLSVDDFIKKTQYIYYSDEALSRDYSDVASFAEKEGLTGHALSARIRNEG